jgi:hypothetical protein
MTIADPNFKFLSYRTFWLCITVEGATGKVSQFTMLLRSNYNNNLCFSEEREINNSIRYDIFVQMYSV